MDALLPTALTAFRVAPAPEGFLSPFTEALVASAFAAPLPSHPTSSGWTRIDDAGSPTLDLVSSAHWHVAPWVALGWRFDEKRIPGSLVKLQTDALVRVWCADHQRETCPAAVRKELAEAARTDLLGRTPATPTLVGVWWETARGLLLVGSTAPKLVDAAAQTFGRLITAMVQGPTAAGRPEDLPQRLGPVSWLWTGPEDLPMVELLTGSDTVDEEGPVVGTLAAGEAGLFLAWLWEQSERADGIRTLDLGDGRSIGWIVRDGLALADVETGKPRMRVRAADAAADPALRVAIVEGHLVESVGLHVERDGGWVHDLVLTAREGRLNATAIELPKLEGDPLDRAVEAGALLADVHDTVTLLLGRYAAIRASDRWGQHVASFRVWLGHELGEWAAKSGIVLEVAS